MTISTAPRRRLPRLSRLTRLSVGVAALTLLTALGSGIAIAADRSIEMRDFAFSPQTVEIRVGDRVTWTNRDGVEHNATNGSFDTGLLAEGESASIRFTAAGTYEFFCTPHPSMTGTVIVRSTAAPDVRLGALLGLIGLGLLATTSLRARRDRSRDETPGA
jgi:plastocyanin